MDRIKKLPNISVIQCLGVINLTKYEDFVNLRFEQGGGFFYYMFPLIYYFCSHKPESYDIQKANPCQGQF